MVLTLLFISIQMQGGYVFSSWTGGPGYPGPYGPDNAFLEETNTEWAEAPGYLMLAAPTQRYTVTETIMGEEASIVSADVNGDGLDDIFAGTFYPPGLDWYENVSGDSVWVKHFISGQAAWRIDTADPDGDGDPDLLVANLSDDALAWFENDSTGWTRHDLSPPLEEPLRLCSADFDSDGAADLVTFTADGNVSWYENTDGTGTSWTHHSMYDFSPSQGLVWIEPAQLDSDSSPEVIVVLHDAGDIYYLDRRAAGWAPELITSSYNFQWQCADAGDVDGDGDLDVIASRTASYGLYIKWFENGSWQSNNLYQGGYGNVGFIRAIDIDGNGSSEVAATGIGNDIMVYMQAEEGGHDWYNRVGLEDYAGPGLSLTGGDFDGDGIMEMAGVSCSGDSGRIEWCNFTTDGFPAQGVLTTSIKMVPFGTLLFNVMWGNMLWDAWQPDGTDIGFLVRASADYNDMGPWSDTIWTQDVYLDSILPPDGIYIQCKAILRTSNADVTPIIQSFSPVGWVPGGIAEGIDPECLSVDIGENPTGPQPSIDVTLTDPSEVELTVYDIAGRAVFSEQLGQLPSGTTSCAVGRLVPGIYFVKLQAGEETADLRFVVIYRN